jgi:hypothetical protein
MAGRLRLRASSGIAAGLIALVASACGGGSGSVPTSPGTQPPSPFPASGNLVFTVSPIDPSTIAWITPLGNLNPPDHATPTDHIYFYIANPDNGESPLARRAAFYAPANGTVTNVYGGTGQESKLFIRVTQALAYYLDHLILDPGITVGTVLTAGQRVGVTGTAYAVDLGVVNNAVTLAGLVSPSRYTDETIHCDAPLKYFEEPLRSQLYARVQRLGAELDGKIDLDVAGRLSGNWYSEIGGTTAVSFAYNTYDPSQVRIAVGGLIGGAAVYSVAPTDPYPRDVSVASGKVRYTLTRSRTGPPVGGTPVGQLLVQMVDTSRVQLEITSSLAPAADFTANARFMIR